MDSFYNFIKKCLSNFCLTNNNNGNLIVENQMEHDIALILKNLNYNSIKCSSVIKNGTYSKIQDG